MACYAVHAPGFKAGLSTILERYRAPLAELAVARFPKEALSYYWYPWHDKGWAKARAAANGWPALHGYPEELEALAEEWGLRSDWAAPWLHACLMQHLYPDLASSEALSLIPVNFSGDLDSVFEAVRGENVICIQVRYAPYPPRVRRDPSQDLATVDWKRDFIPPRQKAKEEAMSQLEQQMDEMDRRYLNRGYGLRDTEPELMRHVHWLFLRICPQPDIGSPWGYQKIADAHVVGKTTVRDAVLALAREMEINLPQLPPGQARHCPQRPS
ncbi:MAG: hypothetical protein A2Y61_01760 [Chloroflexi bacterium RBG_13_60_13]|nr:MAG: hypothetical protein A2Y61_01760 [Chloroflexi bacterium RBG_13_60_13]